MMFKSLASCLVLSTGMCMGQSFVGSDMAPGPTSEPKKPIIFDLSAIDKTADPCVDFYQYACGNWLKKNPIPADQARWGRFNELAERNNYLLYEELKAAADAPKTPLQKKYGDYFAACMNEDLADKLGAKPVEPAMKTIASLQDKKQLPAMVAELQSQYGVGTFYQLGVTQDQKDSSQQIVTTGQGGITLPDRSYYLDENPRSQKLREQYVDHVTKMFVLLGDSTDKAAEEAKSVMSIETALAKGAIDRVELRDPAKRYHIMTLAELQALSPEYNWDGYLKGIKIGEFKTLNVSTPTFFTAMNAEIDSASLDSIKSYMRWHALRSAAPALSKPFVDENFNFFQATLNGQKEQTPRWKRCTRATDQALGEAVGQDWVKQNFPPDAKANMDRLVAALEKALGEDIQQLPWMSAATKVEAKAKLDAIRNKIGYPENWRDYSSLVVKRDDPLGNMERSVEFERQRGLDRLGKPVDEKEWSMTPPTVNAYYNPPNNDINFPAGILQPPFFDNSMDPAVNFGGIGVVIGHEMTHGFDDQGSKYDPKGNVKQWFTTEDLAKFKERTECEAKEYDGFKVAEGQNLNGHLTLGENTADNGGIRIAFQALQEVLAKGGPSAEPGYVNGEKDGYTPAQRFFITFGQVWCQNQTEQSARVLAKTDPHSTGEWRTKGTVQNFDEFGKAFGCKVGQPMMPENSCRVW
jgi:putative endopeptidase